MKFSFHPIESRIHDFLKFPRLLYLETIYDTSDDSYYEQFVTDNYTNILKIYEEKLKPFSKDIERFYMNQFLDKYDFITLITMANPIPGSLNEQDYLDKLSSMDEYQIKTSIVFSIMVLEQSDHVSQLDLEAIRDHTKRVVSKNDDILSFIEELAIDAAFKWNLFLIIDDPLKYMTLYIKLMNSLFPIFQDAYQKFDADVTNCGSNLVNYLNKHGSQGLLDITYSILDVSILESDETKILVSALIPYNLTVSSIVNKHLVWGLGMEEAFKKMKEYNENKTNERVQIFKNLGDKTRYEVLKCIASGETSTKEIANQLGVSSATVSYHLNAFLTTKVIKMEKINNKFEYVVDYQLLEQTITDFKYDLCFPKEN